MSTIHETTQRTAGHISQPFTLTQICEIVMTGQYNADLMLQHLLLCADSLQRENAALRGALNEIKACAPPTSVFHHIVDNALARKEAKQ